jgi:hypothetical protein
MASRRTYYFSGSFLADAVATGRFSEVALRHGTRWGTVSHPGALVDPRAGGFSEIHSAGTALHPPNSVQ